MEQGGSPCRVLKKVWGGIQHGVKNAVMGRVNSWVHSHSPAHLKYSFFSQASKIAAVPSRGKEGGFGRGLLSMLGLPLSLQLALLVAATPVSRLERLSELTCSVSCKESWAAAVLNARAKNLSMSKPAITCCRTSKYTDNLKRHTTTLTSS